MSYSKAAKKSTSQDEFHDENRNVEVVKKNTLFVLQNAWRS